MNAKTKANHPEDFVEVKGRLVRRTKIGFSYVTHPEEQNIVGSRLTQTQYIKLEGGQLVRVGGKPKLSKAEKKQKKRESRTP